MRRLLSEMFVALLIVSSLSAVLQAAVPAAERTAADLLPSSTVIYVEVPRPKPLLSTILDHPLAKKLEAFDEYRQAFATPEYLKFQVGVLVMEQQLGMAWRPAIEKLTGGGISWGFDARTQGSVLLVKSSDEALLGKLRDTVIKLARDEAQRQSQPDPVKEVDFRGIKAYRMGEARFAIVGPWLVLTNKDELGKQMLESFLDGNGDSLASDKAFQSARGKNLEQDTAWSFLRLQALREAGVAKELFAGKATDNPVAELLIGGILGSLTDAPYVTSTLHVDPAELRLSIALPCDRQKGATIRPFFFGTNGKGEAPPLLAPRETVLALSFHRDLAGLWNGAADLFNADVNAKLAQANGGLTTFFSGLDFGQDVLGAIGPDIQFVAARQGFGADQPAPAIKLPASALVLRLKDPQKMQRQWKVTFQSLIGFLNVVGAMNGQPQLELNNEKTDHGLLLTATYVPPVDGATVKNGGIHYNFSPSVAFVGDRFVVCSSRDLAAELMPLLKTESNSTERDQATETSNATRVVNTQFRLDWPALRNTLVDNKQQLVAQNMLEKGHSNEKADKEVSTFLELLDLLQVSGSRLTTDANTLGFELSVKLKP